eukprot:5673119-Pyramimonas_sp.AAC.1
MTDATKQLSRQLRDTARKYWEDVRNRRVAEFKQALEQRNYYLVHKLSRMLAGKGRGPRKT